MKTGDLVVSKYGSPLLRVVTVGPGWANCAYHATGKDAGSFPREALLLAATRVYGQSDDNIYFEGEFRGQAAGGEPDEYNDGRGTLIVMSDGTLLDVKYGKDDRAIWEVKVLRKGDLFLRLDICDDEDADPYSDVVHFGPGIKWAYKADGWRPVR